VFRFPGWGKASLLATISSPAVGLTKPYSDSYRVISSGVRRPERKTDGLTPYSNEFNKAWSFTSNSHIRLHEVISTYKNNCSSTLLCKRVSALYL
jgi:hypothetical protein